MKKANKKGVWVIAIVAIGLILILGLDYQPGRGGQTGFSENKSEEAENGGLFDNWGNLKSSQTTGGGGAKEGTRESSQNSSTLNNSFSLAPKNGGVLGGSYLLKNMSSTKGDGYESANVFVKAISGSGKFPKYGALLVDNRIEITLNDTRNFDFDTGTTSFDGYNPQVINGKIIKKIEWRQEDESIIKINIYLKKQAPFYTVTLANPLVLEVRVAI